MGPWSFSHLEKYETCPRQYYETKVAKTFIEPPTIHTVWGKVVHLAWEERIRDGKPFPDNMAEFEPLALKILSLPGEKLVEYKVALDRDFQPCEWDAAWTRGVIDLTVLGPTTGVVLDYKTGKRKYNEQLVLYSAYVMAIRPKIESVQTAFIWLRDKKVTKGEVRRNELPHIWSDFLARAARIESAHERNSWPERPSGLCKGWCPVKTCTYYRERS